MPNNRLLYIALVAILLLSACAKRNTTYQDDEWLSLEKELPIVGNPLDITIDNNYVYVAQDQGGISLFRRTDYYQTWFTQLNAADGSQANLGRIKKISVVPELNRMFIIETMNTDRITIVNTSNPDTLHYVFEVIGGTSGIKDLDSYATPEATAPYTMAYTYSSGNTFKYDRYDGSILNPNYYTITLPATISGFKITDNYILFAAEQRGLYIYNRSDRTLLGQITLPGEAQKVVVTGSIAYVASRQGGLCIVDFTDPTAPVLIANYDTSNFATAVDVSGNKAAISAGSSGVYLFDVSNPNTPTLLQHLTSCGYVNTAKFMDDKLVVGTRDQGILVYKVK